MIFLKKLLLPLAAVALSFAVAAAGGCTSTDELQQVEFIKNFYKSQVENLESERIHLPTGTIYSVGVEQLLAINRQLCESQAQDDAICGTGNRPEHLLDVLHIDPDVGFEKHHFEVTQAGTNTLDVYFGSDSEPDPDPNSHDAHSRRIRYVFVKEQAGWRIDNVYFGSKRGFNAEDSLRAQIAWEHEHTLARKREIAPIAKKIFEAFTKADTSDLIDNLVAFPLQVCSQEGLCEYVQKGDARMTETYTAMRFTYHGAPSPMLHDLNPLDFSTLPKEGQAQPMDGTVIQIDALEFSFRRDAWHITKIDLRRLGNMIRAPKRTDRDPATARR